MDHGIRRAALRAAAKTAIVLSLSGCYDFHQRPPRLTRADAGEIVADAALAEDAGPPPAPDAGPRMCDPLLAALEITNPEPRDEGWAWGAHFTDEQARLDPEVGACCLRLEENAGLEMPSIDIGGELAMACCDVIVDAQHLVSSSSLGCTPWGPSCPPEMEDEAALA